MVGGDFNVLLLPVAQQKRYARVSTFLLVPRQTFHGSTHVAIGRFWTFATFFFLLFFFFGKSVFSSPASTCATFPKVVMQGISSHQIVYGDCSIRIDRVRDLILYCSNLVILHSSSLSRAPAQRERCQRSPLEPIGTLTT